MKHNTKFKILMMPAFVSFCFGVASCGEKPSSSESETKTTTKTETPSIHTHTFASGWSNNETEHWHAATCEHTTLKDGVAPHVYDDDKDATCNVCGYTRTIVHIHEFETSWTTNETEHWHKCKDSDCTEKSSLGNHEFVWSEKTPAGFHVDKVEKGRCSVCSYETSRTIENTATHEWTWAYDPEKHYEQTTCEGHDTMYRNETEHTFRYESQDEFKHGKFTDCEEHASILIGQFDHVFENPDSTDCSLCGYKRTLAGKASFKTITPATYRGEPLAIPTNSYQIDAGIAPLCEIQYKKEAEDASSYTNVAPTDAGMYDVRIYSRGSSTYLKGELATAKYEIKPLGVKVNTIDFSALVPNMVVDYIELMEVEATIPATNEKITLTLLLDGEDYSAAGRYKVPVEKVYFNLSNFTPRYLNPSQAIVSVVIYDRAALSVTTSTSEDDFEVDNLNQLITISNVHVDAGTLRTNDIIVGTGEFPMRVKLMSLSAGGQTSLATKGDVVDITIPLAGFSSTSYKEKLMGKTFVKAHAETLVFGEPKADGRRYTNSSTINLDIPVGESIYFIMDFTVPAGERQDMFIQWSYQTDNGYGDATNNVYYTYNHRTKENKTATGNATLDFHGGSSGTDYTFVFKKKRLTNGRTDIGPFSFYLLPR